MIHVHWGLSRNEGKRTTLHRNTPITQRLYQPYHFLFLRMVSSGSIAHANQVPLVQPTASHTFHHTSYSVFFHPSTSLDQYRVQPGNQHVHSNATIVGLMSNMGDYPDTAIVGKTNALEYQKNSLVNNDASKVASFLSFYRSICNMDRSAASFWDKV
jgi:hypothetical protein